MTRFNLFAASALCLAAAAPAFAQRNAANPPATHAMSIAAAPAAREAMKSDVRGPNAPHHLATAFTANASTGM